MQFVITAVFLCVPKRRTVSWCLYIHTYIPQAVASPAGVLTYLLLTAGPGRVSATGKKKKVYFT